MPLSRCHGMSGEAGHVFHTPSPPSCETACFGYRPPPCPRPCAPRYEPPCPITPLCRKPRCKPLCPPSCQPTCPKPCDQPEPCAQNQILAHQEVAHGQCQHHGGQAHHHGGQAHHHGGQAHYHGGHGHHHDGQAQHHGGQDQHHEGHAHHHGGQAQHHGGHAHHHGGQDQHHEGHAHHHGGQAQHHGSHHDGFEQNGAPSGGHQQAFQCQRCQHSQQQAGTHSSLGGRHDTSSAPPCQPVTHTCMSCPPQQYRPCCVQPCMATYNPPHCLVPSDPRIAPKAVRAPSRFYGACQPCFPRRTGLCTPYVSSASSLPSTGCGQPCGSCRLSPCGCGALQCQPGSASGTGGVQSDATTPCDTATGTGNSAGKMKPIAWQADGPDHGTCSCCR